MPGENGQMSGKTGESGRGSKVGKTTVYGAGTDDNKRNRNEAWERRSSIACGYISIKKKKEEEM
jgi:hypothetical protein